MCAICFEEVASRTPLPCSCKVCYCMKCWDRALAHSFNACRKAMCPTCRCPVHVDFDAETRSLLFSKETEDLTHKRKAEAARQKTIDRLVEQAKPAQVKTLEQFGHAHPILRKLIQVGPQEALQDVPEEELQSAIKDLDAQTDGCVEQHNLIDQLAQAVGGNQFELASYWATRLSTAPSCVCGASFQRVAGSERVKKHCRVLAPDVPSDSPIFQLLLESRLKTGRSGAICDLCDARMDIKTAIWTCENNTQTILHATAYDVCDACFIKHTCSMSGLSTHQQHSSSSSGSTS